MFYIYATKVFIINEAKYFKVKLIVTQIYKLSL